MMKDLREAQKFHPNSQKQSKNQDSRLLFFPRIMLLLHGASTWCLEELAKIVEFMETNNNHTVIPVFYKVDPSDVRKQKGEFKKAFDKHQQNPKIDSDKIQRWRAALERVANIVGDFISAGRPEAKLIEDIVNHIWSRLDFSSFDGDQRSRNLVGMDYHWKKMKALLEVESEDVRFIGVCGMGGIGKTYIARYVYDKISDQYEGGCFLENVRHVKRKNVVDLQIKLLSNIMKEANLNIPDDPEAAANHIRRWSCRKRIIVVLDDVDKLEQLEMLAGNHNWFGSGSRIIITTRDQHVLRSHGIISSIYKVKGLKEDDALQLFHINAFKNKQPKDGYFELSMKIIYYVRGHPLALKVLGRHLCDRGVEEWNSALNRLRQVPSKEILETLQLSYDGLEELEKQIFLDIACFFNGKNKGWVSEILDSCDFHSTIGISVLIDRSLITISNDKVLDMHDLLQELGWAIVRERNPDNRGEWSRLWRWEDVYHVLTEKTGTKYVEGIMFNEHKQRIIHLDGKSFSRMINLRLLKISNVDLLEDLEYLSNELRYLKWHGYPSNSLPSNFHPRKLFELDLCHSQLKYLWKGMETFERLKTIKLSYSHILIETLDFTWVPNLEMLDLEGCTRLRKVHDSVGLLKRLTILNLKGCKNLVSFRSNVSRSLKILNLKGCSKLDHLPQNLGEFEVLEELDAGETAIRQVPPSIARLSNLESLFFRGCKVQSWWSLFWPRKYLDSMCLSLPRLSGLSRLKRLDLSDCGLSDGSLPSDLGSLCSLKELQLGNNNFVSLPESIKQLSKLEILCVENCHRLQSLPRLSGLFCLKTLDLSDCGLSDGSLPSDLGSICSLKELKLSNNNFVSLPDCIKQLSKLEILCVENCHRLQSLPCLSGLFSLKLLDLSDCGLSDGSLPSDLGSLCSLKELKLSNNNFVSLPDSIKQLSKLEFLRVENCQWLQSLPELPHEINFVGAEDCVSLEDVSNALRGGTCPDFALHLFNCLKLHENLGQENNLAIMLLKQYLLQHPVNRYCQFHIRLPGFDIPEWFSCKNDGNSVKIRLSPGWLNDDFIGIAMCGVFEPALENLDCNTWMAYTMSILTNKYLFRFKIPSFTAVKSHHLWLAYVSFLRSEFHASPPPGKIIYVDPSERFIKQIFEDESKKPEAAKRKEEHHQNKPYGSTCIRAAFHIGYKESTGDGRDGDSDDDKKCKVIKCGIRLVYKQDKLFSGIIGS